MLSTEDIRARVDLHDLASKLGLERPGNKGNYKSPHHDDKAPSLSIFKAGKAFKDHSANEPESKGDAINLVRWVEGCDVKTAIRRLHEIYGWDYAPAAPRPQRALNRAEYITEKCFDDTSAARQYLIEQRKLPEQIVDLAIAKRAVGQNNWTSNKAQAGEVGYGGTSVAFIARSLVNQQVLGVDMRYIDPELNGGLKTMSQGEKEGVVWYLDYQRLLDARTIYVCESAINALTVEACNIPGAAAIAIRGLAALAAIDWRWFAGKQIIIVFDADEPDPRKSHNRAGAVAAWQLYELLTDLGLAAALVDHTQWHEDGHNDINDIQQASGTQAVRAALEALEKYPIPGLITGEKRPPGRQRAWLPAHDYTVYWRYHCKLDHTTYVAKIEKDEEGGTETLKFEDVCGFRIASLCRVSIASPASAMSGDTDLQPTVQFSVSVQVPRHGPRLQRRVFSDDRLHNVDVWKKFGPVYAVSKFSRLVNLLERTADLGAREAVNFVGLAYRKGKLTLNEGPDCYFTEPEKQCPYHNLTFPSGPIHHARTVLHAYSRTFKDCVALHTLVWALGGHLKAQLGFWPHMVMQARKAAGKSTLVKRLERCIGMTVFGGQSLQTEFRLLTTLSHTSHPVGWEEISTSKQDVIDKAVAMLQQCYQHVVTRRGSDMTEYLQSAPVLLAGEDVPVRSLTGKVVRVDLSGRKVSTLPDELPRFPVRNWLKHLETIPPKAVRELHREHEKRCWDLCRSNPDDDGASRMVTNYAALFTAWELLAEFAGCEQLTEPFRASLVAEMNAHIAETSSDREPWVWIMEMVLADMDAGEFRHPFQVDTVDMQECLLVRPKHIMHHLASSTRLRQQFDALPVKSARVFKQQLDAAGVVITDKADRFINGKRYGHLCALSTEAMEQFGLYVAVQQTAADRAKEEQS